MIYEGYDPSSDLQKFAVLDANEQSIPLGSDLVELESSLPYPGLMPLSHSSRLNVPADPLRAFHIVLALLSRRGPLVSIVSIGRECPVPSVAAQQGSGFLNMNTAAVIVYFVSAQMGTCTLLLAATAREGVIKQYSARKAVRRLERELQATVAQLGNAADGRDSN